MVDKSLDGKCRAKELWLKFICIGFLLSCFSFSYAEELLRCRGVNNMLANETIWLSNPGDLNKNWEGQVFHLGNSYFGASCYGGVQHETFTLSEKTFWIRGPGDGNPSDYGIIPNKDKTIIDEIKKLTSKGDIKAADPLVHKLMVSDWAKIGAYSTIGSLNIDFKNHEGQYKNYTRALDLGKSIAKIQYQIDGVNYKREYFCSYPDRVLAIRLTCDKDDALNFNVGLNLAHVKRNPQISVTPETGMLEVSGNIDDNNMPYRIKIKAVAQDGKIESDGNVLKVQAKRSATLYYTVATNYILKAPMYRGADPEKITSKVIDQISSDGFNKVRQKHISDYQNLYSRTRLYLENKAADRCNLPTNERLNYYINGDNKDLGLKELAFNFGKYFLISASRPGSLAAGLYGPWNNQYTARWYGVYQIDANVTQTYMFGNALNLSECQEPIIDYIKELSVVGKDVAKAYFGTNGWTSHVASDIWGHAGILNIHAYTNNSSGWLSLILWEHYAFDQDEDYLKKIYPILKGASQFYLENLIKYKDTEKLVTFITASAEHVSPIGSAAPNYMDLAFINQTFKNTIKASKILNRDSGFRERLFETRKRLMPFKIGRLGQFQEWVEDVDDIYCQHRHMSHLLAIQPCDLVNPHIQPELAAAVRVSLYLRGDADFRALNHPELGNSNKFPTKCTHDGYHFDNYTSPVWCRAARLSTWLRLFAGDRADKIYNDILRESTLENMVQYESKAHYKGSETETPFFLEGTILSAGNVTEMVLQSQYGELDLLPALPSAWKTGYIKGIRARGGFTVDIEWKNGKLVEAKIVADKSSKCKIRYNDKVINARIEKGKEYVFSGNS